MRRIIMTLVVFACAIHTDPCVAFDSEGSCRPLTPPARRTHTVVAMGDVMPGGSALRVYRVFGHHRAFGDTTIARLTLHADAAFCNLECPATSASCRFPGKTFTFRTDREAIRELRRAGFDLVSLANNHILDFGVQGLLDTMATCSRYGLAYAGAGMTLDDAARPAIVHRHGIRYGLLAYSMTFPEEFWATPGSPGTAHGQWETVRRDVAHVRPRVDVVLVSFHWGGELTGMPKKYQIDFAHHAIACGADAVLGHHPHVVQPVEIYRSRPVFYSLGNFAFGSFSRSSTSGMAAEIFFTGSSPTKVVLYPLDVDNRRVQYRPSIADPPTARKLLECLRELCEPYGTRVEISGNIGRILIGHSR